MSFKSTKRNQTVPTVSGFKGFPVKLHNMLSRLADNDESVASWNEKGDCFKIHKRDEFATNFRHRSFKSFQRQLSIYNFSRVKDGPDKGYYYHPNFIRDDIQRCKKITRGRGSNNHHLLKNQKSFTSSTTAGTVDTTNKNVTFDFDTVWDTTQGDHQEDMNNNFKRGPAVRSTTRPLTQLMNSYQQGLATPNGLPYEVYESNSDTILWMMQAGYSTGDLANMLDILPSSSSSGGRGPASRSLSSNPSSSSPSAAAAAVSSSSPSTKSDVSDFAHEILGLFYNSGTTTNSNNKIPHGRRMAATTQQEAPCNITTTTTTTTTNKSMSMSLDSLASSFCPTSVPTIESSLQDVVNDDPLNIDDVLWNTM